MWEFVHTMSRVSDWLARGWVPGTELAVVRACFARGAGFSSSEAEPVRSIHDEARFSGIFRC